MIQIKMAMLKGSAMPDYRNHSLLIIETACTTIVSVSARVDFAHGKSLNQQIINTCSKLPVQVRSYSYNVIIHN